DSLTVQKTSKFRPNFSLSSTVTRRRMTPISSSRLIRRQHGLVDSPTFSASSATDSPASACNRSRSFRSIGSSSSALQPHSVYWATYGKSLATNSVLGGYKPRMAVADWFSFKSPLALEGDNVRLRPPRAADYAEWSVLRRASRDFLQPWEPAWPADELSLLAWRRRLAAYQRELDLGLGFAFFVFRK